VPYLHYFGATGGERACAKNRFSDYRIYQDLRWFSRF